MNTVAAIMIIFSSFAVALLVISKENRHCAMLKNADELMSVIKSRADYYSEPLSEILKNLASSDKKEISSFCNIFAFDTDLPESIAPEVWCNAVDKYFSRYLETYECDVIKHFGESICGCNRGEIGQIYNKAHNDITAFLDTANEKRCTNTKSTAAITVSVGIMIVLMLV